VPVNDNFLPLKNPPYDAEAKNTIGLAKLS
jgi:hypothetical protein